ncbi:hypothetical protein Nepgr_010339 [Nepenthes gracilis]|uniref:non-specific serine/threonine protein kinase n=1 Tax=Nepenthes gracilis TaxID=150966 RepID=A0AAD3SCP4_NEPGR|nr:hypothetical protein Nepgr_010339 [Nepenthes gracilis]
MDPGAAAASPSATTTPTPDSAATTVTVLGKYQLGRLLGRGSFAKVYHGRTLSENASVAIKVIDKSKTDASMEPRIIQEVAAMRRLNHPNILRIHEVMATKSKIYLVMDLAKGGDLFEKLARRAGHRYPEPYARRYFHQLVSALHYCHQNGVVHRDMKPQNILLDQDGNIKISDFGLSAVRNGQQLLHTACGTPAFAAPEVVSRRGYDGAKADAWSCGVILFVMLTGSLPFDDSNLVTMYRKMYRRDFQFPCWVSRPARALIYQLLDPNPKTRLSIEAIMQNSWYKSSQFGPRSLSLGDLVSLNECKFERVSSMNAFDIISMSSGLDLSGLFDGGTKERRFTSQESAGRVMEKVAEVGGKLGYEVERGKSGKIWLGKGRLLMIVEVLEVAVGLLVVEVKVVDGGAELEELHWGELKSGLGDIVLSWQNEEGTLQKTRRLVSIDHMRTVIFPRILGDFVQSYLDGNSSYVLKCSVESQWTEFPVAIEGIRNCNDKCCQQHPNGYIPHATNLPHAAPPSAAKDQPQHRHMALAAAAAISVPSFSSYRMKKSFKVPSSNLWLWFQEKVHLLPDIGPRQQAYSKIRGLSVHITKSKVIYLKIVSKQEM